MMIKANIVAIAKVLLFWVLFVILMNAIGAFMPFTPNWLHGASIGGSVSIALISVTYFFLKSEKMTFVNIGISFSLQKLIPLIFSLVAGMAFFGCFYLVYLWLTPVIIVSLQDKFVLNIILLSFLSLIMLSAMEEIAFRGYTLKKLETTIGPRSAIYLTSLAFGLYHGFSFDNITGPAVWGLLYAVLASWSKGLAVPIGFHAGANLIQALFGEKSRYADGIWSFDIADKITPFTIDQISLSLKVFLFIASILLVEIYLYQNKNPPRRPKYYNPK
jgi:membrane protease YdiL (CAAX protease family)